MISYRVNLVSHFSFLIYNNLVTQDPSQTTSYSSSELVIVVRTKLKTSEHELEPKLNSMQYQCIRQLDAQASFSEQAY